VDPQPLGFWLQRQWKLLSSVCLGNDPKDSLEGIEKQKHCKALPLVSISS